MTPVIAVASPPARSSNTGADAGWWVAACCAKRTSALPLAYCSRQPSRPHPHGWPSGTDTVCPSSPAIPWAPRTSSPPRMMPPPMPVPTVNDSMVLFTVGTGIGGGIILGGELVRGAHGIAGELGHTVSVPDGHPCGCGRLGCLEQYASGKALVRFAQQAATHQPASAPVLLDLAGGDATAITGVMVTAAAREGDHAALSAFDQIGYWLGSAMADAVQILDPQVIVIGGGVSEAGKLLLDPVRIGYRKALKQRGRLPVAEVRAALLGNLAGVVGAADLARQL